VKVLLWIIALILAIPTYGISLVIAMIISIYINKQEEATATQVVAVMATALKIDIANQYNSLRMINNLPPTKYSHSKVFKYTMNAVALIEEALDNSNRFHNDKNDIIQLATRFVSYSEDYNEVTTGLFINEDLKNISLYGVNSVLIRPYRKPDSYSANYLDDDIPF
jgi:hypothetical protein